MKNWPDYAKVLQYWSTDQGDDRFIGAWLRIKRLSRILVIEVIICPWRTTYTLSLRIKRKAPDPKAA